MIAFIEEMEEKMPEDITVLSMSGTTTDITMQIEVPTKEAAAKIVQQFRGFDSVLAISSAGIQSVEDEVGNEKVTFNVFITYAQKIEEVTE